LVPVPCPRNADYLIRRRFSITKASKLEVRTSPGGTPPPGHSPQFEEEEIPHIPPPSGERPKGTFPSVGLAFEEAKKSSFPFLRRPFLQEETHLPSFFGGQKMLHALKMSRRVYLHDRTLWVNPFLFNVGAALPSPHLKVHPS